MKNQKLRTVLENARFVLIVLLIIQAIAHIGTVWVKENKEKENFMRDVDPYVQAGEYDRLEEYDSMPFLGREFTDKESIEQDRLAIISEEMTRRDYDDIYQDVIFADGSWRAQDDTIILEIIKDDNKMLAEVKNPEEILEVYRTYSEDSYWSVEDLNLNVYYLSFESFYLDGTTVIPEKVSVYEVKGNLLTTRECKTLETLTFDVTDTENMLHYEVVERQESEFGDENLIYGYDGKTGYIVNASVELELASSIEENRKMLQDVWEENRGDKGRDILGFRKYFTYKEQMYSDYYGQDVTVVAIGLNPLYHEMNGEMILKCCLWIVGNLLAAAGIGFVEMLWTNHRKKASK